MIRRRMDKVKREHAAFRSQVDPVMAAVEDPEMSDLAIRATIGCGCTLVDFEHEDPGIMVIPLEKSSTETFDLVFGDA
jgi:hypothetical protein